MKGTPKALRIGRSISKDITVNSLGIDYLQDTIARGISRGTAEKKLIAAIGRGQTEYLAAKKFSESSVHIFGQKLFYTAPYEKAAKAGWEALPYAHKRAQGVDLLRTAFVPFHKAIQDVGEEVKKPFLQFYRQSAYQTAKARTRIKEISKTTSKAQTRDVTAMLDASRLVLSPEEQAAKAVARAAGEPRKILPEREVDPEAVAAVRDLRKILDDAFDEKVALGMIKEDQYRKGYMPHILTKEGRKYVEEKHRDDINQVVFKQGSSMRRTLEGNVAQINKWMQEQHGAKKFFVDDPYLATQTYISKHVRAVEYRKLREEVLTKHGQPTGFPLGQAPENVVIDGIPQTLFKYSKEKESHFPSSSFARSEIDRLSPIEYKQAETYIPTSVAKELQRTHPTHSWWTDTYDPALATLKKSWIAAWPGYYARNLYGGVGWQNILAGVEPADYAHNVDILYGDPKKVYDIPLYGKKTGAELKELMESHNIYGQTGYIGEPATQSVTGVLSKAYEKYPEQAMRLSENQLRGPVFLHYLKKTGDPEYAAEMVYKFHFEYLRGTYSEFEEEALTRFFPFYKWARGNIPLQSEMVVRQPGTYAALAKWNEMGTTPEEYNKQPDWSKEKISYVAGATTITTDLPVTDLPGLYGADDLWFATNPFAKLGVHALTGRDQHGRYMYPPTTLEGAKQYTEMTAKTFAGRHVFAMEELEKTRTGERPLSHTALHQIAGVGVYSPKQDAETKEQRSSVQIGVLNILTQFTNKRTKATVARVIDGDTIELEDGTRVRLLGIDTAEKGEPTYEHAKQKLEELVLNKEVYLESGVEDQDHYGRSLRYVFRNNENINLKMVKEGYAPTLFFPQNKKYKEEFEEAERIAIKEEIGPRWNETVRRAFLSFETEQHKDWSPTLKQKEAAWEAAGKPKDFHIKTLADGELLVLPHELYEASKGFKPTEEQLKYILATREPALLESPMQTILRDTLRRAYDPPGSREARYNKMVAERQEFKSGQLRPEQPTEEQRMESWRRAGLAPGQSYIQKVYRDDLGQLQGVSTFTPDEMEEMEGWKPSETEARRAFRDARKMLPKEQFKLLAREYAAEQEQERLMEEELAGIAIGSPIQIERDALLVPLELMEGERRARRQELEDMLGRGVDR
uniref:TNase-like domain-containing protein n=1 Tax=Candidatus Methanogaster sp. ANME-2c ERB4 TaxID=2759911 RepID=A0A7G9Y3U5_9EURY|nr:hypothetical protein GKPKHNMI_00001 [Methanosarcinales archaeon ANME-2c ERB4]